MNIKHNVSFRELVIEKRSGTGDAEGTTYLSGVAVPYDQWSQTLGWNQFKEKFMPGCFTEGMKTDILCTVNHDMDRLLGRRSSGTLKLDDRADGLYVECGMPNTQYARDLCEMVSRRDVRGMSFDFIPVTEDWGKEDGIATRIIHKANLFEVCFTPDPAYLGTSVALQQRSMITVPSVITPMYTRRVQAMGTILELFGS